MQNEAEKSSANSVHFKTQMKLQRNVTFMLPLLLLLPSLLLPVLPPFCINQPSYRGHHMSIRGTAETDIRLEQVVISAALTLRANHKTENELDKFGDSHITTSMVRFRQNYFSDIMRVADTDSMQCTKITRQP